MAAIGLLIAGLVSLGGLGTSASAGAEGTTPSFYLDLGASASVGFQPTASEPRGEPTSDGYADDLVSDEAARGVTLDLTELGCPGETTITMLYGGGNCYPAGTTQLSAATTFLQDHAGDPGLVTLDLGYNDVAGCFAKERVSTPCVNARLATVSAQMPRILASLKSAAGPDVTFVGVGHYDPFLADELLGHTGQAFALKSSGAIQELNLALQHAYRAAGIPMADVQTAFEWRVVRRARGAGVATIGNDVLYTCELTWMCQSSPYGPDAHPNDAGYATIAAAIEAQLKAPW